jgi:SAM-dependent methyltransferase
MNSTAAWPKLVPPLAPEQQRINEDSIRPACEVLPAKFSAVEEFGHRYVAQHAPHNFLRTLEIGARLGRHIPYEKLSSAQARNYHALEWHEERAAQIKVRFPTVQVSVGDCQERLEFVTGDFDRVIAIHVLEHLPDLSAAICEMRRLCEPDHGIVSVVILFEGRLARMCRTISGLRILKGLSPRRFCPFVEREHRNRPQEFLRELEEYFEVVHRAFFPTRFHSVALHFCIGLTLKPKRLSEKRIAA